MHPAPSVIIFSTLSGAGFGLLFWLGLGFPSVFGLSAFWIFGLAYLLAVGGLISSTFHLGHPERALLAFTQWRTSWLSREGISSVAALLVMAGYAIGLVFFGQMVVTFGLIGAALSLFTVLTTAMIYTQMKTVPRWRSWLTPALFLTLALAGGAILGGQRFFAMPLIALAALFQIGHWRRGDHAYAASGASLAAATGLTGGAVRQFAPPHTGTNYLMREMVHVVGRRHAVKLRLIALALGYVLPFAIMAFPLGPFAAGIAGISHLAGVFASRWLFFAEAEHVVGLYYGRAP